MKTRSDSESGCQSFWTARITAYLTNVGQLELDSVAEHSAIHSGRY